MLVCSALNLGPCRLCRHLCFLPARSSTRALILGHGAEEQLCTHTKGVTASTTFSLLLPAAEARFPSPQVGIFGLATRYAFHCPLKLQQDSQLRAYHNIFSRSAFILRCIIPLRYLVLPLHFHIQLNNFLPAAHLAILASRPSTSAECLCFGNAWLAATGEINRYLNDVVTEPRFELVSILEQEHIDFTEQSNRIKLAEHHTSARDMQNKLIQERSGVKSTSTESKQINKQGHRPLKHHQ